MAHHSSHGLILSLLIVALAWSTTGFAAFSEKETHFLDRTDGSQITYYLQSPKSTLAQSPVLLVLQGSQYESVFDHGASKQNILQRFSSALLMIEKPGVTRGSQDCNENYKRLNNLESRLADILAVLKTLKTEKWWNRKLLLLGGSEGGPLAVKLSKALFVNRAVLLVTGGGMTMEEAMPTILRDSMKDAPPEVVEREIARLPQVFADIRKNPDSIDNFFGECNTYKYWNSILWFRPVDTMLMTQTKYLLIHGDRDASHPVESARITARLFHEKSPQRLIYWEKPDLDHALMDSTGKSYMGEILNNSLEWLFSP
jgi:pimeloyl-ACP methyl ester carboxylesterase